MVQKREVQTDVVISGIGGYFPRSYNIEDFKKLLLENVHIQDQARWKAGQLDVCDITSNIPDIDCFDASYFGIHRQQCIYMDPMQRTALEKTFEAIIDAGYNPADIRGKKIGVYMGSCISENDSLMFESVENGFGITGQARTMLANRISYWLNVTGPSCSFDSSWTNGAQIIQFALEAIRSGQCEAAIVGATNLALNIYPTWLFKAQGLTSPDGFTRAFDENADGYSRGEAIIALYLQRADCSKRCYATVVHAEAQFNGNRGNNFTHVDADHMTRFLEEFYSNTTVDPRDIHYVETYGCGIKQIDEVELSALENVYCKDRKDPLLIGSVKTNSGHAEAAEGLMSLVKVIVATESGTIPATLHHSTPNKNISALFNGHIKVVTQNIPWMGEYAAINSIGLASSFGHILVKINPQKKLQLQTDLPLLRTVSSRTEDGLKDVLNVLSNETFIDLEYSALIHDVFSSAIFGHLYRGYVLHGETTKEEFEHFSGNKTQTWFVYSGMGSQWQAMGKDLMKIPIFAQAINKCHDILIKKGVDLKYVITTEEPNIFDNILHSFVGIAAIQIGLTDILYALDIIPDGIIGHSVGELGCAYADGSLTAEQMILCAYYRGKASLESELITGMMAAIGMGPQALKKIVPPAIDVACHNGPDSSTLSGPTEDMKKFVSQLQEKGVFAKLVNVSNIAYHSRYIRPAAPLLLKYLKDLIPNPISRSTKWISTSIQESEWSTKLAKTTSAEYLTNNLLSSVYFSEGCRHIPPGAIVIEIAPHGLLQAILRRSLAPGCINVPLTKRGSPSSVEFFMTALGKLYVSGLDLKLASIYPPVNFPVSRGTKSLTPLVRWEHSGKWRTGLEEFRDYSFSEKYYVITMNSEEFRELIGHKIEDTIVIPVAALLMVALDVLSHIKRVENAIFENIVIRKNIQISPKGSIQISVMVQRGTGNFEVSEGQNIIVTGTIFVPEKFNKEVLKHPPVEEQKQTLLLSSNEFYEEFEHRGYNFSGIFKSVGDVDVRENGNMAKISWSNNWSAFITSMMKLQLLHVGESNQNLLLPISIRRLAINLERQQEMQNEIDVSYHASTGLISCPYVQIAGINYSPFSLDNRTILVNNYKFISFMQEDIKDIQYGLNIFLEIILQNKKSTEEIRITEIKSNYSSPLLNNIHEIFDQKYGKQVQMELFKSLTDCSNASHSLVLVLRDDNIKDAYIALKQYADFVIISIPQNEQFNVGYPISVLSKFTFAEQCFFLLKKVDDIQPIVIEIPGEQMKLPVYQWMPNVTKAAKSIKEKNEINKRIFLFLYDLPNERIEQFLNKVNNYFDTDYVRFVFILDKNILEYNANDEFYKFVYQHDLKLSVYYNKEWGTYTDTVQQLCLTSTVDEELDFMEILRKSSDESKDYELQYITLEPYEFYTGLAEDTVKYIGYAAINAHGSRVMGTAKLDLKNMKIIPDPYLQWPVQEFWSIEDAVTIPYHYTMAYYTIVELCQTQSRDTVLIHDGCSSFGLAAIDVAYSLGCTTYTTVGSDQEKAYLMERNKQLLDHHIMNYEDCNFEKNLMIATSGGGVDVILNCFGGARLLSTIRCLATLGRIIHYRINEIDWRNSISLGVFLKCTCMSGISSKRIFETSSDIKRKIQELVFSGQRNSFIKPLERELFDICNAGDIQRYVRDSSSSTLAVIKVPGTDEVSRLTKIKDDFIKTKWNKRGSHVIFGDNSEDWLNLVEWLTIHGIKKIFIVTRGTTKINRRLHLLEEHHGTDITFYKDLKHEVSDIKDMFHKISAVNPISTIFILHSQKGIFSEFKDIPKVVDVALESVEAECKIQVFCIWGTEKELFYKNQNQNIMVSNISWENKREFKDMLCILDTVMNNGGDVLLKNEKTEAEKTSNTDFSLLFPLSTATMKLLSETLQEEVNLHQWVSSCPRTVKEILPVFVVPALNADHCPNLRYLIKRLMYPVYAVVYGKSRKNIRNQANKIVKSILQVQPKGPYNLLGVSWGGALILEIAQKLEEIGNQTQTFLIDAVPDNIQAVINSQTTEEMLHVGILSKIFDLKETQDSKKLMNLPNWSSRVEKTLRLLNVPEEVHKKLQVATNFIEFQVNQMRNYQYQGKMINGPTKLFRPENSSKDDSFGLTKYCKQVEIKIFSGNHLTMMQDDELIEYINDNILM